MDRKHSRHGQKRAIAASTDSDNGMLQSIGVDAICLITQYLSSHDLRPFTQLNRAYAQLLQQRHQAYHHRPLPSFHRTEFNLNTYRKWLNERSFLVISSPDQLLAYSRSRILNHATDIELRLDAYCQHPTSAPITAPGWFEDSTAHMNAAIEKCFVDTRAIIHRFQYVRSLRLWYRPSAIDLVPNIGECSCSDGWLIWRNWFMEIANLCLEMWSSKLISLEVEMDPSYPCGPYAFRALQIPRLPALQHLGLFFPPNDFYHLEEIIPESLTAFQFSSEDCSVLIFDGGSQEPHTAANAEAADAESRSCTNASQILWLSSFLSEKCDVYQYLAETNQLRNNESTLLLQLHHTNNHRVRPIVSIQPHQLRTFTIDPLQWPATMELSERVAYFQYELEWMVDRFTRVVSTHDLPSGSLESLVLFDLLCYHASSPSHDVDYSFYLDQLRHQLRIVTFYTTKAYTQVNSGPFFGTRCDGCGIAPIPDQLWKCEQCIELDICQRCFEEGREVKRHNRTHGNIFQLHERYIPAGLTLPFSLVSKDVVNEAIIRQLQWSQLECLILRTDKWESSLEPIASTAPPMMRETWIALDRTLPALESLGLSLGLLPLQVEPLSGVLLRIKHLGLFDSNSTLVPEKINLTTYCNHISSALTTIVTQLRQLESLNLNLQPTGTSTLWNDLDCLTPLLLSSANLCRVSIPSFGIEEYELNDFESKWQKPLFHLYALWTLLQPSFEPPLDYTSPRTFLYPLLPPISYSRFEMVFIDLQYRLSHVDDPEPTVGRTAWSSRFIRAAGWTQMKLSGWWSQWSEWKNRDELARQRELKRLEVAERRVKEFQKVRDYLKARMVQLYQQHPHLIFQPRIFTLQLLYESDLTALPMNLM